MKARPRHRHARNAQSGLIGLVTALLLGLVVAMSLFSVVRPNINVNLDDTAQTERALALAKEALIGYATGRNVTNRPGELPCPDTTNDGTAEANCSAAASQIGRLPWATLGIPDLRDGSGERLWYAVSNRFKNSPAVTPLNSNTASQLSVTGISPATNVIAVVLAPGAVVGNQVRTLANINNAAHYLDGENANGDTVFTMATPGTTFNDRLLAITSGMFFPAVEMAVVRHLRVTLGTYYGTNAYYPPANAYGSTCLPANQGRVPSNPSSCGAGHASFASLPPWFSPNRWEEILFYAVAPACVNVAAPKCTGTGGLLTVNGNSANAVIISPGPAYAGQARPCGSIADCLELPNATTYPMFAQVNGSSNNNDRMVAVP